MTVERHDVGCISQLFSYCTLCFQQSKVHLVCHEGPSPLQRLHTGLDPRECTLPGPGVLPSTPNPQPLLPPSPSPWRPQTSSSQHPFPKIIGNIERRNTPVWVPLSDKAWLFPMCHKTVKSQDFQNSVKRCFIELCRGNFISIKNKACQYFMTFPSSHLQPLL